MKNSNKNLKITESAKADAEVGDYSLLERLTFSSPEKCKKLCVKAVKLAISDEFCFLSKNGKQK